MIVTMKGKNMPYPMTHLIIAKNIAGVFEKDIKNLPDYYSGSLAPDAVHNRTNFTYDYKKKSHLFVGMEEWGFMTNHDECTENAIAFFITNRKSKNHDFILGYCVHILSDIYNHLTVFTPFVKKYHDEIEKTPNLFTQENSKLDIELALTYKGREEFWLTRTQELKIGLLLILC